MVSASQRRIRIAILTIGITSGLFFLLFPWVGRGLMKRDHDEAPQQQGVATVEQVTPSTADTLSGQVEAPLVEVRFRGKLEIVRKPPHETRDTMLDITHLHVGSEAQIVYRIGRSGRVYIDSVAPLPTPATPVK